ncbi:hypothetical protein N658DRAFT_498687 [Parathielavia hyrcaniae]|uniref:Rhodopsin domain-containing protein n=1 Tax=Parathielavia hyrcaniae TaxID=113614 RepID=A0AAN6PZS0_9PEZI|nr:hypothetical protein N658DRAFT_498687 [Parathielavia hyrcaniae]
MAGPHNWTRDTAPPGEHLGLYLNRVIWALAALSGLFLGLRLFSKLWRHRGLWWDDHFLIASWVALVVSCSLQSVGVTYGLGRLYAELDEPTINAISLYSMIAGFGSILATCWSKTSLAISLLRLSDGWVRWLVWLIIVSVNLVLGSNGAIQWVQCWPIHKRWNYMMEGTCFDPKVVQDYNAFIAGEHHKAKCTEGTVDGMKLTHSAAFSGFMDIVLALLPWKIIWTVSINKREKLGALVAMSAGLISGVMAFLKIRTLYVIGNDNTTTVDLFIFGTAEPATMIMAASIPLLRALLVRRDRHPEPTTTFIELADRRRKTATSPPPPESSAIRLVGKESADSESWAKVSHLEAARPRGHYHDTDRGVLEQKPEWAG